LHSLRHARGRYAAERAAQLSGIPVSTIYDWNRNGIYVPDYGRSKPMAWSYRDLVYLRVLAWLRAEATPRPEASERVAALKRHINAGNDVAELHADRNSFILDEDLSAPLAGRPVLFADMLGRFDLVGAVVEEFGRSRLWGPDLVAPSDHTYISPWVLGGDPCIDQTRIPTAAVFTLREERGLDVRDVIALYPDLSEAEVEEAHHLERRLRGLEEAAAA
jgi:uncharacterized protein (DUF433 family)